MAANQFLYNPTNAPNNSKAIYAHDHLCLHALPVHPQKKPTPQIRNSIYPPAYIHYISIHKYKHTHTRTHTCIHAAYALACACVFVCVRMRAGCMCAYVYLCVCVCVCILLYILVCYMFHVCVFSFICLCVMLFVSIPTQKRDSESECSEPMQRVAGARPQARKQRRVTPTTRQI